VTSSSLCREISRELCLTSISRGTIEERIVTLARAKKDVSGVARNVFVIGEGIR
jgi:hypothetical protein